MRSRPSSRVLHRESGRLLIGEQFAKVKENLKYLRNGNGFVEWCEKRAMITLQTANNYINAFERRESIK